MPVPLLVSSMSCWGATLHMCRGRQQSHGIESVNQTSPSKLLYLQGWGVVTANLTSGQRRLITPSRGWMFPRQPASTPFVDQSKGRSKGRFQFSGQCLIFTPVNRTNGTTALSTSLLNPLSRWSTFKQEIVMLVNRFRGDNVLLGSNSYGNSVMALNLERSLRHLFDSQTHRPPFSRRELVTTTPVRSVRRKGVLLGLQQPRPTGIGSTTPSFSLSPKEVRTPWSTVAVDIALAHDFACVLNQGSVVLGDQLLNN